MSDRLEWYDVTIPANTPKTALFSAPLVFLQGVVTEINLKILDGPCGTVGFFLTAGGTQFIPRTPGSFVIPNDDYMIWPVKNAINSGSWGIQAYNTDAFNHLIQVAFHVDEPGGPSIVSTKSGADAVDTLTASLNLIVPGVVGEPGQLSLENLLNNTPLGSTVTSPLAPLDVASLIIGVNDGTP